MTKKEKQIYIGVAGVLVVIALIWLFKSKPVGQTSQSSDEQAGAQQTIQQRTTTDASTIAPALNTWDGTLKMSDNSAKGNLMLVTKDHTVYLKTSRDFSALVGKEVTVVYTGTVDSFTLENISAK